ncbi:MAG TPA: nitronate monooxygenase [Nevskiaceae bacterium]|nr:nitronate monooxygenase [Nevskiaceae bacterium]
MTHFLESRLGLSLPVIQAPMAGAQDHRLALAAAGAGALGSIPAAMMTAEGLRKEVAAFRAQSSAPLNVNFFCHTPPHADPAREATWRTSLAPYYAEHGIDSTQIPAGPGRAPFDHATCDFVEEVKPEVVSFHFGLPTQDLLDRVRAWKPLILSSATTVDEALWLESKGVDAIIAQGAEAGGHRGIFLDRDLNTQIGTFALVPQIVAAVKVPVIAAGGVVDAHGAAAARAMGAGAVQCGTALLLCAETLTSAIHRAALKEHPRRPTALTHLFTGRPARSIVNRLMRDFGPMGGAPPEFPLAVGALMPLRQAAEAQGSGDFSPLWSGQNNSRCREAPAADVIRDIAAGW